MADGGANWNGEAADHVDIEIDINAIANALVANDDFIRKVTREVRNQLLRQARPTLNIFGKYAGGR